MGMDVNKILDNAKIQERIPTIRNCRESGLSVLKWCSLNSINEAAYYYWPKIINTIAVENYKPI